jgi:hypothetical protein
MHNRIFTASVIPNGVATVAGQNLVRFSVCIDVNHDNPDLDETKPGYQASVNYFYSQFLLLSDYFGKGAALPVTLSVDNGTITNVDTMLSNKAYWQENCQEGGLEPIRDLLWRNLFTAMPSGGQDFLALRTPPAIKDSMDELLGVLNINVPLQKNVTIGTIASLNDANTLYNSLLKNAGADLTSALVDAKRVAAKVSSLASDSALMATFAQSSLAAEKYKEMGQQNRALFTVRHSVGMDLTSAADVHALHELVANNYVDTAIDVPETFITFSQLSHHPVLMRLFGLIIDFEVPLATVQGWGTNFKISIDDMDIADFFDPEDWSFPATNIETVTILGKGGLPDKYAFLPVALATDLFHHSILDDKDAYLINHDPMAQEQKLAGIKEKADQGFTDVVGELHDSFTRGIIYNHKKLPDIITPQTPDKSGLYEEHVTMGSRVVIRDHQDRHGKWISLTKRSTKILSPAGAELYNCGYTESCIHFDQVGNYMDPNSAQIDQKTSEALFEFKGEFLTLNTIFSRESKVSTAEIVRQTLDNPPDPSTANSQRRMNKFLDIDYYPYDKKVKQPVESGATPIKLRYGLADGKGDQLLMPSLIFGKTYQFLVYNQYRNGWALPLSASNDNDLQATLEDIWHSDDLKVMANRSFLFKRLENSKPVVLFSNKPIGKASQEAATDLKGKDSLLHLVLRDATDNKTEVFRHVLPERISLEQAFWAGLLYKMTPAERHIWKCRYNYADSLQPWQTDPGDLDCSTDLGGTKMKDFYTEDLIPASEVAYLPDPVVDGFTLQLYWDADCTEQYLIAYADEAIFDKPKDYVVSSYGFSLKQQAVNQVVVANDQRKLTIFLKPGMKAYAKLYNHVENADKQASLGHDYWLNQLNGGAAQISATDFKTRDDDPKSQPLIVSLTNTTRTPLIPPALFEFRSAGEEVGDQNVQDLSYITQWIAETVLLLRDPDYPCADRYGYLMDDNKSARFSVDKNILSLRPLENGDPGTSIPESTNVTFQMVANFERLDAVATNNFLPDVAPTGVLEVWMKKEEFKDDPAQYVSTDAGLPGNHFPEAPVYAMDDLKNQTYHDYKFDWSPDVLQQLKTPLDPTTRGDFRRNYLTKPTGDPFRDTVSKLAATYNTGTTQFEYRQYALVNTSKFKGYYSDNQAEDSAGYQLRTPKRLPVLLLGNKKPDKPIIAYLVTTIKRTFDVGADGITTVQRGNLITVYLNRGRLSSGRDERVGVLIKNDSEYSRAYLAADTICKAGRDVITDRLAPQSQFIRYGNDKSPCDIIKPRPKDNKYDMRYDQDLAMVSYLPRFDIEKQLWKFEIEFDLRSALPSELHNPFINLAIVHFQPFALDHNDAAVFPDLDLNTRISDAETTTFCYLLPQRKLTALFHKPAFLGKWGTASITFTCDQSSLNAYQSGGANDYKSNFLLCVEGSSDKMFWEPMMSQSGTEDWRLMHPLIDEAKLKGTELTMQKDIRFVRHADPVDKSSIRYHHFRLRLVEVEWFKEETWDHLVARYLADDTLKRLLTDVLEIEDLRVRYVELIY